jgi:hypothetical protein
MVRRTLMAATAALAVTLLMVAGAGAASASRPGKIGPNQAFVGLVNGKTGAGSHAQVRVACAGPIRPGETTHPLPNQPLEVMRPSAAAANFANTGAHGTHITAFLGIPPSAGTPPSSGALPTFWHYGVEKPIPTTIEVPCSGSGYITFIPFPRDPGSSKAFVVPVDFVNIAV